MFINPVWEYQLHNGVKFSSIFEHIKGMGTYPVKQATIERNGERIEFELNNGHWFCLEAQPNTNGKFVFFGFDDEQICDEMDISLKTLKNLKMVGACASRIFTVTAVHLMKTVQLSVS